MLKEDVIVYEKQKNLIVLLVYINNFKLILKKNKCNNLNDSIKYDRGDRVLLTSSYQHINE